MLLRSIDLRGQITGSEFNAAPYGTALNGFFTCSDASLYVFMLRGEETFTMSSRLEKVILMTQMNLSHQRKVDFSSNLSLISI
jgi:hypothetical protein